MDLVVKKSSLEAVADEIRTRNGSSAKLAFPNEFTTTIANLQLPQSLGTVNKQLTANEPSYVLPAGIYDGGRVFATSTTESATPSTQQQTLPTGGNTLLSSATVGAITTCKVATGIIGKSSDATTFPSLTISGLPFRPVGCIVVRTGYSGLSDYSVWNISSIPDSSGIYGFAACSSSTTRPGAKITSAKFTYGENSITISDIIAYHPNEGYNSGGFTLYTSISGSSDAYSYIVFGI